MTSTDIRDRLSRLIDFNQRPEVILDALAWFVFKMIEADRKEQLAISDIHATCPVGHKNREAICAGCSTEESNRIVAERDEARAEVTRLTRTVDRKDGQMAELQEHAQKMERERDEARANAERWRQKRIKDREIADGDVGCHLSEVGRAHARVAELEAELDHSNSAINRAQFLVDEASYTDDGQAMYVDPSRVQELRESLDALPNAPAQPATAAKEGE